MTNPCFTESKSNRVELHKASFKELFCTCSGCAITIDKISGMFLYTDKEPDNWKRASHQSCLKCKSKRICQNSFNKGSKCLFNLHLLEITFFHVHCRILCVVYRYCMNDLNGMCIILMTKTLTVYNYSLITSLSIGMNYLVHVVCYIGYDWDCASVCLGWSLPCARSPDGLLKYDSVSATSKDLVVRKMIEWM